MCSHNLLAMYKTDTTDTNSFVDCNAIKVFSIFKKNLTLGKDKHH